MMHMLEKIDLERRVSIYSKCIFIAVNNNYKKDVMYNLEGIKFSYNDIVNICHYVIDSYGNDKEKRKYRDLYKDMDIVIDKDYANKLYYERLGYIYEIKKKYGSNNKNIKEMAKLFKFNVVDINRLCYEYIVDYLKFDKLEYEWFMYLIGKKNNKVKVKMSFSMLLELLCKFDNKEDIVDIIDYSGYNIRIDSFSKINSYIKLKCSDKSELEKMVINEELTNKLKLYMKVKGYNDEVIDKEQVVRNFIESDYYYVSDFCKSIGMNNSTFESRVNYVMKNNRKLYDMYLIKVSKGYSNNMNDDGYIYRMICYWIVNGYNDRQIDLLDLFSIPGFNYRKLEIVAVYCLNRNDYVKVCSFIKKSKIDLDKLFIEKDNFVIDDKNIDYIKTILSKYNIDESLASIGVRRLFCGVKLDDLVINDINCINMKNNGKIKEKSL